MFPPLPRFAVGEFGKDNDMLPLTSPAFWGSRGTKKSVPL